MQEPRPEQSLAHSAARNSHPAPMCPFWHKHKGGAIVGFSCAEVGVPLPAPAPRDNPRDASCEAHSPAPEQLRKQRGCTREQSSPPKPGSHAHARATGPDGLVALAPALALPSSSSPKIAALAYA